MRLFSNRHRPVHLGPYPQERLPRRPGLPELARVPPMRALRFDAADALSLSHAMARYMAMFDLVRDGPVQAAPAEIPDDPAERSRHLKAAAAYFDVPMAGVCAVPREARLAVPIRNPAVVALGEELERSQPKSFAAGLDMILADVLDSARQQHGPFEQHGHAIVLLVPHTREPRPGEPGCDWLHGTQDQRAALLAAQTAVLLSSYLRLLGHEARAHSASCSERAPSNTWPGSPGNSAAQAKASRSVNRNSRISVARSAAGASAVLLSHVSLWEIAIKHALARSDMPLSAGEAIAWAEPSGVLISNKPPQT
jgi:hypothetical protein